jgi:hypothetical protein
LNSSTRLSKALMQDTDPFELGPADQKVIVSLAALAARKADVGWNR